MSTSRRPLMRLEFSRSIRLPALIAAVLALSAPRIGNADDGAPCETVMRIHGSATIGAYLVPELLKPFLKAEGWTDLKTVPAADGNSYTLVGHPAGAARAAGVYVEISDPENALGALDQGFADIAMCARRARPAEVRQLSRLGELTSPKCEHVVALDAVAIIVNAANPVDSLTRIQLRDIFLRHTTSWQDVGGSGPIHLYAPELKSGSSTTFQSVVLEDEECSSDAIRLPDNAALAEAIARDPRGIAFVSLTFAGANRIIAIADGKSEPHALRPVAASIRNGEYPLARRLYFYTAERPENPLAQKFLSFALGPTGQTIATQGGFVSPTLEPVVAREPAVSLAATSPPTPPTPAQSETHAAAVSAPPAAPPHVRPARVEETPPTRRTRERPETRPEPPAPSPTPAPRPTRPVTRPTAVPAATPDTSASGTGGG